MLEGGPALTHTDAEIVFHLDSIFGTDESVEHTRQTDGSPSRLAVPFAIEGAGDDARRSAFCEGSSAESRARAAPGTGHETARIQDEKGREPRKARGQYVLGVDSAR